MVQIQEINDVNELRHLQDVWSELLAVTEGADFFRTLVWLQTYWKHHGEGQKLRVLVMKSQGCVVGILPLAVAIHRTKIGRFRALSFPLDFWGSCYGAIGPDSQQTIADGLRYVFQTARDWDYADLRWLRAGETGSDVFERAADAVRSKFLRQDDDCIAVADLRRGWEEYWKSRSGNWRSNCRRNLKKAMAAGEVEYIRYRPRGAAHGEDDAGWHYYDEMRSVALRSWQARSHDGTTMTHNAVRPFLRDLHVTAAREGHLDLNLLRINGTAVAFNYNYHYRGYVSSLRLGFDPAFASYGVGTVLTRQMLEDSCRRGDHTFDFLPGSLPVKQPWLTSLQSTRRYQYLPMGLHRVGLIRAKRWLSNRLQNAQQRLSLSS